ncbi:MAG: thioredoxin [Nanoarchaeota archaeon]
MAGKIEVLSKNNFDAAVAKGTVIVDFYADWCGPCKIMAPAFEKAAARTGSVKFAKLNVDGNQKIAMRYGVMSIPTTIVFKNGQIKDMHAGALSESEIMKLADKYK